MGIDLGKGEGASGPTASRFFRFLGPGALPMGGLWLGPNYSTRIP